MNSAVWKIDVFVHLQRFAVGVSSVTQFGVINRMRLLPNEKWGDRRRPFAPIRAHHLRPAHTAVTLQCRGSCEPPAEWTDTTAGFVQAGQAAPTARTEPRATNGIQGEALPYQLLQVRPVSGGGNGPARLYGNQVLRENDPAFEFVGPWIRAAGEINRAAVAPEMLPVSRAALPRIGRHRADRANHRRRRECDNAFKAAAGPRRNKLVLVCPVSWNCAPLGIDHAHVVPVGIERALKIDPAVRPAGASSSREARDGPNLRAPCRTG